MTDKLELGPTPSNEDCAQVGSEDYAIKARAECRAMIAQLRRGFGPEPEGARLIIASNPHDYGSYLEVAVKFDDNYPQAVDYAFKLESEYPSDWDDTARLELGL